MWYRIDVVKENISDIVGIGLNAAYLKVQFQLPCTGNTVIVLAVREEGHEIPIYGIKRGLSCINHIAKSSLFHLATNMQKLQSFHCTKIGNGRN
jgi:hypothetical protein